MSHEFETPIVVEIPEVRELLTPDDFAVFPERRPVDTLSKLGRRILNELKTRYVATDSYDEG